MKQPTIGQVKKAISEKFNIPIKELTSIKVDGKTVVLHGADAGLHKGSWNTVMNAPLEEYAVTINGRTYDTRKGMSWAVYKAFADQQTSADKSTWTLLTGEPVPEWCNHYYGDPQVPNGYRRGGQVGSDLDWADDEDSGVRVRLAVILEDLELDTSSSPSSLELPRDTEGVEKLTWQIERLNINLERIYNL